MEKLLFIAVTAFLVENVVLYNVFGICPFLGVSKKTSNAVGMGLAVTIIIVISSNVTWALFNFILKPLDLIYLQTLVFILVIASLVQLVEMVIKKFSTPLYKSLGVYLPLITTNCAILGVAQGNTDSGFTFAQSMANAIGTGLGFALVLFVFSCIRVRLESANVPKAFSL